VEKSCEEVSEPIPSGNRQVGSLFPLAVCETRLVGEAVYATSKLTIPGFLRVFNHFMRKFRRNSEDEG